MKIFSSVIALVLFFAVGVMAEATNDFVEAIIQGRKLAEQILAQRPTENFTNMGVLKVRDSKGKRSEVPIKNEISVTANGWQIIYEAAFTNDAETFTIVHSNLSTKDLPFSGSKDWLWDHIQSSHHRPGGARTNIFKADYYMAPFADSDFTIGDLSMNFFHWPTQKVLKKEIYRSCACTVLESTNPNPTTNGYSRVVSWIDTESLGIVEAYAYDFNDKKLKDFYPKDIKKVNGQWQVQTLVMENVQTGSRSRLEFDLKQ
jgi:hypothetical protein